MQNSKTKNHSALYSRLLLAAAILVIVAAAFLTYRSISDFRRERAISQQLIQSEGNLRYYDEVLTMSARAAAFSGNLEWQSRYNLFRAKMSAELISIASLLQIPSKALDDVSRAADELADLEGQSLALAKQGLFKQAQQIFFSEDHERAKDNFANGLERLNRQIDTHIGDEETRIQQNTLISVCFIGALIVVFFLLLLRTFRTLGALLLMQDIRGEVARRMLYVDPSDTEDDLRWALRLIVSETDGDCAFLLRKSTREGGAQIQQWWDQAEDLSDGEVNALWDCLEQLHQHGAVPLRDLVKLTDDEKAQSALLLRLGLTKILSAYVDAGQGDEYYLCWGTKKRISASLPPDDAFLQAIAKIKIGAIKTLEYEATLTRLATTDGLTRLYNRHHFTECLAKALKQCHSTKQPYALLMLDLDHFKDINDTYGHPAGDAVLQKFADTLRDKLREIDIVGRLGGEEFGIILPDTDAEAAVLIADRLREEAENTEVVVDGHRINITICIGLTTLDEADTDIGQAMSRADDALYCAKEEGRNRVKQRMRSDDRPSLPA